MSERFVLRECSVSDLRHFFGHLKTLVIARAKAEDGRVVLFRYVYAFVCYHLMLTVLEAEDYKRDPVDPDYGQGCEPVQYA